MVDELQDARACTTCGSAMVPEQDWCLACGAAAPGRLGGRPGWRAAGTVAGLTVALVCGAVAASYAALSDDATRQAGAPPAASGTPLPGQQAQVPPAAVAPVTPDGTVPPAATTPPATTTPTIPTTTTPTIPSLPSTGSSSSSSSSSTTIPSVPSTGTSTGTTTTTKTTTTKTTTTGTTTTDSDGDGDSSTRPELTNLSLGADALSLYDPYEHAEDKGDPADAQDDRDDSAWFVTTPSGKGMQVGLLVDLEANKLVRAVNIKTSTPGFRLELYGADTSTLPPDILDTRWAHIGSRSDVDQNSKGTNSPGDGEERVVLPKDGDRFRYVLLWFTTPPDKGTTVKLGEVNLLG